MMTVTTKRRSHKGEVVTKSPYEATTVTTVTTFLVGNGMGKEEGGEEEGKERNKKRGNNREIRGNGGTGGNEQRITCNPFRLAAVTDRGNIIGEDHPRAVLADAEVLLMLELRDEGFSYGWLAEKFEVSKSCVQKICNGSRRACVPHGYKRIRRSAVRG